MCTIDAQVVRTGYGTNILWKYVHTFFFVIRTGSYEGMHTFGMRHKRTLKSMYTHAKVCMPFWSQWLPRTTYVGVCATRADSHKSLYKNSTLDSLANIHSRAWLSQHIQPSQKMLTIPSFSVIIKIKKKKINLKVPVDWRTNRNSNQGASVKIKVPSTGTLRLPLERFCGPKKNQRSIYSNATESNTNPAWGAWNSLICPFRHGFTIA
jgi:hypothetical protein